jgi:hypothetical protein
MIKPYGAVGVVSVPDRSVAAPFQSSWRCSGYLDWLGVRKNAKESECEPAGTGLQCVRRANRWNAWLDLGDLTTSSIGLRVPPPLGSC